MPAPASVAAPEKSNLTQKEMDDILADSAVAAAQEPRKQFDSTAPGSALPPIKLALNGMLVLIFIEIIFIIIFASQFVYVISAAGLLGLVMLLMIIEVALVVLSNKSPEELDDLLKSATGRH